MRVYTTEPPWEGRSSFGSWRRGEELWDGTTEWTYSPFASGYSVVQMSNVLRDFYVTPLKKSFQANGAFLALLAQEFKGVTASTSRTSRATTKWSSVRSFLSGARFRSSTTRRSSRG